MKKSLIILSVLILIFSFVGCSANPSTATDGTNGSDSTGKVAITDYTSEGVTNVTGVSINKNNSINVDVMCPHCEKETFPKFQKIFLVSKHLQCLAKSVA